MKNYSQCIFSVESPPGFRPTYQYECRAYFGMVTFTNTPEQAYQPGEVESFSIDPHGYWLFSVGDLYMIYKHWLLG